LQKKNTLLELEKQQYLPHFKSRLQAL